MTARAPNTSPDTGLDTAPNRDPAAAPKALRRLLPGAADTDRVGAALAAHLRPGDTVLLTGDLGAGKSALARACIRALLAEDGREQEDIPSPSFTLVQVYDAARAEVWHVDLYRLGGPEGCAELGLEDAFDTAICLVEWPDRLGPLAPARRLDLTLSIDDTAGAEVDDPGRWLTAHPSGPDWDGALAALAG
jgi:tRNA threonylcarbamoyladenosine biosynthesis protein TsaE